MSLGQIHVLERRQRIAMPQERVFEFFSQARNLQQITPPWMSFDVITPEPIAIAAGTLIDYRLKLHGVPLRWRTRIEIWEPPHRFVVSWDISCQWKADTAIGSEVEVRFLPDGPDATLVELEHRKFERMGGEAGEKMRKDVDGGWPAVLEHFRHEAET